MVAVRWSPEAELDLDDILQYFSKTSPHYAIAFLEQIDEAIGLLRQFPQIGRHVPESINQSTREVFVDKYRLIYRFCENENEIAVLMVIHGSRLLRF